MHLAHKDMTSFNIQESIKANRTFLGGIIDIYVILQHTETHSGHSRETNYCVTSKIRRTEKRD